MGRDGEASGGNGLLSPPTVSDTFRETMSGGIYVMDE